MKGMYKFLFTLSIVTVSLHASDESPGEVWIPTLGGLWLGGIAGGWKGAAIGGGVGIGVGLTARAIRKRRAQRRANELYAHPSRAVGELKNQIIALREENFALRDSVRAQSGRIYPARGVGYRNINGLSMRELEREHNRLEEENQDLQAQLNAP